MPPSKKKSAVEARPAKHGKGVFATQRLRPGRVIGEVTGKLTHPDHGSEYCIDLGDDRLLEPSAPWRYLNHCCEPNSKLYVLYEDDDPLAERRVVLETLKNVQPGVELTIDYQWSAESAIPCGCDSEKCRGWIVDLEELHLLG